MWCLESFVAFVLVIGLSIEEPSLNRTTTRKALVAAKAWVSHYPNLVLILINLWVYYPYKSLRLRQSAHGTKPNFGKEREADGRVNSFLDKNELETEVGFVPRLCEN
mgnify:CR=1 FL=1